MSTIRNLSRRQFLGGLTGAGGLLLGLRFTPRSVAAAPTSGPWQPDLFLRLAPDGAVTILAHRSEMGTGIRTSLPMIVAEELGADWSRVRVEQAIGDERLGSQDTDGSRSIRDFYQVMQSAGATARAMLESAAAARWKVAPESCEARDHQVHHTASGRSLPFGELVEAAAALKPPAKSALRFRDPAKYVYVGKDMPIVDRADILTGKAIYGMDVRKDGMKYAAIARPPSLGARLKSFDAKAALAVPGVEKVIEVPAASPPYAFKALGGVACVASDTFAAFTGRDRLKIEWEPGPHSDYDSVAYRKELEALTNKPGEVVRETGDTLKALEKSATTHEADYYAPHLAHASMEPPVATAHFADGACEVWAPTQNPQASQETVAQALGIPKGKVTVHVTLLGGGFGRKSQQDFVAEAALVSRAVGAPVKVVWSRMDDLQHDYYHSVSAVHLKAGLNAAGKPLAWLQRCAFPSIPSIFSKPTAKPSSGELGMGMTDMPFLVENLRCEAIPAPAHVRIGWLRSVANVFHAFAVQSFAGELAALAHRDPVEYLLELIGPPRHLDPRKEGAQFDNMGRSLDEYPIDTARLRNVTELVAKLADWKTPLPRGRGRGIAVHRSFLSYVATVVEVDITKSGALAIPRVATVIDCGRIINPDRVRSQMEGAVVFGASLALMGEITSVKGAIQQTNFGDYKVARIHEAPRRIDVELVHSDALPAGVGEPGVPPVAPAITNAIFAAIGKRIRALPVSKHDLSWS